MIRINLLPFREARKKENIKRQISVFVLSVVLLLALMGLFYFRLNAQIGSLEHTKHQIEKELAKYKDTNKELERVKKRIDDLKTKLEVIRTLEKNKTGPVRLLDEIAMAVPKDKLWLRSLKENGGLLLLEGTAMDNETVALFMTNLEAAKHIRSVNLKSTKLRVLKQYKLNLADFSLECKTYSYKEKTKPKKKKGKKRRRGRRARKKKKR